jgi:uncharacterized membrane protein YhaH (DUF805 family)
MSDVKKYWWRVIAWTTIFTVVFVTTFIVVPGIYLGIGLAFIDLLLGMGVIVLAVRLLRRLEDPVITAVLRRLR